MGKVDWIEVKQHYISNVTLSYSKLADHYGVSKATVQSYGTRHDWTRARNDFNKKKSQVALNEKVENLAAIERCHLDLARFIQYTLTSALERLVTDMNTKGLRKYHAPQMATISRVMMMAMDLEAAMLGMERYRIKQIVEVNVSETDYTYSQMNPVSALDIDKMIAETEKTLRYFKRRKAMIEGSNKKRPPVRAS